MNSSQLSLALDDVVLEIPWSGRSPRGLTRVANSLIFKAQAAKKRERSVLSVQYDLFDPSAGHLERYRGAPSLLSLPRRVKNG